MTESPEQYTADVIIVGAGISGLMAAHTLQDAGLSVAVIDKGRSVGGRLATRRIGPGIADHGAQFFTTRSEKFEGYVQQWLADGLIYVWSNGFSDGSLMEPNYDGNPRYAVHGGMNALAKHVAKGVEDIRLERRIVTATFDEEGWIFQDEDGVLYTSRGVIMTPPVPQSLEILDAGATSLDDADFNTLATITYAQCLTAMFWIDGKATLPPPGAVQRRNTNIIWIGDNKQKGISPEATIITMQASEQFSRQMWSAPDARIVSAMETALGIFLEEGATVKESQIQRWRYSRPLVIHPDPAFSAELGSNNPPLVFCGDAFGGPRVEGAALSGLAAGNEMINRLK